MKKESRKVMILGVMVCVLFLSVQGVVGTGRIAEFRDVFKKNPTPRFPEYVAGVVEEDLYDTPTPDQLYSFAKDSEVWTRKLLAQLRNASIEADDLIDKWVGDPVLVVFIDFPTNTAYAATFSPETGTVLAEYEDTKTELWASLSFIREFIMYASTNTEEDSVDYALGRYYYDWGAWVEMGPLDIMLTPEMIYSITVLAGIVGFMGYRTLKRR